MADMLVDLLNEILLIEVDSEVGRLNNVVEQIKSVCRGSRIPFVVGLFDEARSNLHRSVTQKRFETDEEYIAWLEDTPPSFVVITPICAKSIDGWDVLNGVLVRLAKDRGVEDRLESIKSSAEGRIIQVDLHAIYGGTSINVAYSIGSKLGLVCATQEVHSSDDGDCDGDDDDFDDDYVEPAYLSNEDVRRYASELASGSGFSFAKNQADRINIAKRVITDELGEFELERIAKEAAPIYKMEILPARIAKLNSEGMLLKDIAETVGESLSKVRQVIAMKKAEGAFEGVE